MFIIALLCERPRQSEYLMLGITGIREKLQTSNESVRVLQPGLWEIWADRMGVLWTHKRYKHTFALRTQAA